MRTYGVNGFKAYIRNHIKLGHLFASLVASRSDLFRIITSPAFALTVISIVPRIPALLRQYMAIKLRQLKLEREPRTNGSYYVNGESKTIHANGEPKMNGQPMMNGGPQMNGGPKMNEEPIVIGRVDVHEKINNREPRTMEDTPTNGLSKINGTSKINGMFNMNGYAAIDGESHIRGEPQMVRESNINGKIDVAEKVDNNGEPKIEEERGIFKINGTAHINSEPKLNGVSMNADFITNDEVTSCAKEWYIEYANMVTKNQITCYFITSMTNYVIPS